MEVNETNKDSNGGTELMQRGLYARLPAELLDKFQIIPSRVRELDKTKYRILWLHDLPEDPESERALSNDGWKNYHRIVFVSYWQQQRYIDKYNIPWSKCVVMQNAIVPFEAHEKPKDKIRLIYTSTPHRGLTILFAVFNKLCETYDNIELDVYSSFKLYGWADRDEAFQPLFDQIKNHPKANYHGAVPNSEIREALKQSHIFAYPSIWPETSCLCLIEAMSAGLLCVHPAYGALPETAANWTLMYNTHESLNDHANVFYGNMVEAIQVVKSGVVNLRLKSQVSYVNLFYDWDLRAAQWNHFLNSVLGEPLEEKEVFIYRR
jgi:UDP-glucose:(glucosyl)LPS alpha-1,2-glucosyltransferase